MYHKENLNIKREKIMRIQFKKLLIGTMKIHKNKFNTMGTNKTNGFKILLNKHFKIFKSL